MRIPDTYEQISGDNFMLGISPTTNPRSGKYTVGPWALYGPAKEKVRGDYDLREHLLVANPKVPNYIKRLFVGRINPEGVHMLDEWDITKRKGKANG